ncbi:MAG: hypothetical protein B6I17_00375 [Tenericutes bacterium 4572_104]|nr:MAG: hypothetical protein B6I17_00375 [Tenericutes bacterium 4572_104]
MKIIRITAMWCMSCLAMKKTWKKTFKDYKDIEIIDYDFDIDKEKIQKYNVGKVLPELIVYINDLEVKRIVGEKTYKEFKKIIEELHEKN